MNKKKDILEAALRLFTENGVKATSTKAISVEAGVSEALIFKHFQSKPNLLEELIKQGYKEAAKVAVDALAEKDPFKFIELLSRIPELLVGKNPLFWRMQYNILPLNEISKKYHRAFIKPCNDRLVQSFSALGYDQPELEADLLLIFIDSFWKHYASGRIDSEKLRKLNDLMLEKYQR